MSVFEKGVITVLVCHAVFFLVSIPLVLRKIQRNPIYGYRTRAAMANDPIWYATNAFFGRRFAAGSVISAAVMLAIYAWGGLSPSTYMKVSVVMLAAPIIAAVLLTERFLSNTAP
jgi:hypothetical protein